MEKIVVIGGGLMGSAVAWKLAEQGAQVTLLEQQGKKYTYGSSFGVARISRSLGPKNDIFSFVHNRTVKEVKNLIAFLNKEKGKQHHIDDIYRTSPVSYLYTKDQVDKINQLKYKKQRKDYQKASGDTAFKKFGVRLKQDEIIVREFRKYSGTLNPHVLIQKLHLAIGLKKGKIVYQQKVISVVKKGAHFELEVFNLKTKKTKKIQAKKVVVAVGPYTVDLLKDFAPYLNKVITPKRVLVSFFKITKKRYKEFSKSEVKSIVAAQPMFSQIGKEYYSMIEQWEKGMPIFKAGGHKIRYKIKDLDKVWGHVPRKKELKWIKKQFRKYFEMLNINLKKKDIECMGYYNCMYSMTPSEVPVVSHIYNRSGSLDKNIVVIGGMSGVGAKGCLGYGSIGANLLLDKREEASKIYKKSAKAFRQYKA